LVSTVLPFLHRLAASGLVGTAWTEAGARVVEGTGTPIAATIREVCESALKFSLIRRFPYYWYKAVAGNVKN
jgi:hypothetical protein